MFTESDRFNYNSNLKSLLDLTSKLPTNDDPTKLKIKEIFQQQSSELIEELMAHPEHAPYFGEIKNRIKKADPVFFKQIKTSIASIPTIAKQLSQNGQINFDDLKLPEDLDEIRSIRNVDVRIHLIANLINRDHPSFRELKLSPHEMMAIGPLIPSLDWEKFMAPFGGNLPDLTLNSEPLCHAIKNNLFQMSDFLLALNPNVNLPDSSGNPPLSYVFAAIPHPFDKQRQLDLINALIAAGADVNVKNAKGEAPLFSAMQRGLFDIAKVLIAAKADVNVKNADGRTPLFSPARVDMVKMLIDAGADVNAKNVEGETPLFSAILFGHADIVKTLIDAKADVNVKNAKGEALLYHAIRYGGNDKLDIVRALIDAKVDVNAKDANGKTPLFLAVWWRADMVKTLIAAGADVNAKDAEGKTPLFSAIWWTTDIVETLIAKGADVNVKNAQGETPLFSAIKGQIPFFVDRGRLAIIRRLIAAGTDANARNLKGEVPLKYAVKWLEYDKVIQPEIIKSLIRAGAEGYLNSSPEEPTLLETVALYKCEDLIPFIKEKVVGEEGYTNVKHRAELLAHVAGLKGIYLIRAGINFCRINSEGFYRLFIIKPITKYVKKYFSSLKSNDDPYLKRKIKFVKNTILEALDNGYPNASLDKIFRTMKEGKPGIILGGTTNHCIASVIKGNKLSVSNRGLGRRPDATEVFLLPENLKDRELLIKLSIQYENVDAFYEMLDGLKLEKIKGYAHKSQKVGNCTVASLKAALYFLFVECLGEEEGREMYKNFTSFLRDETFQDYAKVVSPNDDLLKLAEQKATEKAKRKAKEKAAAEAKQKAPSPEGYIWSAFSGIRSCLNR